MIDLQYFIYPKFAATIGRAFNHDTLHEIKRGVKVAHGKKIWKTIKRFIASRIGGGNNTDNAGMDTAKTSTPDSPATGQAQVQARLLVLSSPVASLTPISPLSAALTALSELKK